jgi:Fe-S cluster assembly protein SufB
VVDFSRRFILEKDAELVLCGYVYNAEYSVEVISAGSGVRSNIAYLLMSQDDKKVKAKIISRASFPHVCTEVSLVSFVGKNGNISVDGIVEVAPNCPKSRVYLREDNIFLDTTGVIRSVPSLLILSADVQAGHAARVERVSEEKLFYLLSR